MKGQKLHELQEKYTINGHCLICGKGFQWPFGRWDIPGELQSGTCSRVCEEKQERKEKYPGHTEADYIVSH